MQSGVTAEPCSALVSKYRDSLVALGHEAHTVRVIVDDVARYANWIESLGLAYDRVNLDTVTAYVAFLRTQIVKWRGVVRPMKASTIRVKVSRAKRWYDFLRSRDYIYHNPFEGLGRIRTEKKLPEFLTEGEMDQLLSSIADPREMLLCELFYATGGRISEVRGLDVQDVDAQAGRVKLRRKGNRERYILISAPAIAAFKLYLPIREMCLAAAERPQERALLVSPLGKRWSQGNIREHVRQLGVAAGLKKYLHPHMFRHSFATHLLNGKANLREVQELMDHADLSTTGIYLHVAEGQKDEAHRRAHPRFATPSPAEKTPHPGLPGSSSASPVVASLSSRARSRGRSGRRRPTGARGPSG